MIMHNGRESLLLEKELLEKKKKIQKEIAERNLRDSNLASRLTELEILYEDDNRNDSVQQVKYVTFSENISDERKQAIWDELRAELSQSNENLPEDYAQNSGSYVNSEGETIGLLVRRAFFERRA